GRGLVATDCQRPYGRYVDTCKPVPAQIVGHRGSAIDRHPIESEGKFAGTCSDNLACRVIQLEVFGNRKRDSERWMQEAVAADITLLRLVTENHAVDASKKLVAVFSSVTGRPKLLRMLLRQFDAARCVGVAGQEVQAGVAGAAY